MLHNLLYPRVHHRSTLILPYEMMFLRRSLTSLQRWNVISVKFLFFTSLRRDAPFLSVTLNLHKQIIFAVLAEYEYERVQNLVRVSRELRELSLSRAERGPGFSPQSLARLAQDNQSWLKVQGGKT